MQPGAVLKSEDGVDLRSTLNGFTDGRSEVDGGAWLIVALAIAGAEFGARGAGASIVMDIIREIIQRRRTRAGV